MQPIDIHLVWILVAGKGLGEDVIGWRGRSPSRHRQGRKNKGGDSEGEGKGRGAEETGGDEPEAVPEP